MSFLARVVATLIFSAIVVGCSAAPKSGLRTAADVDPDGERIAVEWPELESLPWSRGVRDGSRDVALIISIEKYASLPHIRGAHKNGKAWQRFFQDDIGLERSRIVWLRDEDAEKPTIERELKQLLDRVGTEGRAWFVFIGHGAVGTRGGLLVGANASASANSLRNNSLEREDLLHRLGAIPVPSVAVLDACFSGKMPNGQTMVQGLQPAAVLEAAPPSNVTVLSAAQGDEFAGPLPKSDRPAFSYLVLGALRGWGDLNHDHEITAAEATTYTQETLHEILHSRDQRPRLDASNPELPLASGSDTPPTIEDIGPGENEQPKQEDLVAEEESRRTRAQQTQRSVMPNIATDAQPPSTAGWKVAARIGSVVFVAGAVFAIAGWSYWDDATKAEKKLTSLCPTRTNCSPVLKDEYEEARQDAKVATYLTPLGGGLMVIGAGMWVLGKTMMKSGGIENMSLAVLPGGGAITVRGSL